MARASFFRIGQPVRIPVNPTSGPTLFDTTGKFPMGNDLTFLFVNPCPFDIRLEGSAAEFAGVTSTTGWLILARTTMGPFTSKYPKFMSAQAVATPGMALPSESETFSYADCYLELFYGRGD